jgi:hypothetical protein
VPGPHHHGSPALGLLLAALAAVLFAVGAVLQHEAAERSKTPGGLSLRLLVKRKRWMFGQAATMSGTAAQVAALAVAPVAVVQPMLAVGLVVALGLRAIRIRQAPLRLELFGAALTTGGLAVFLVAAQPAKGIHTAPPSSVEVVAAVVVSMVLVAAATLLGHGAHGVAVWGAILVAVVAIIGGQQAYARGSLAWSLPALILLDPLAAIPAARWLLGERLEPGHAVVWVPAAIVAAIGVVLLARTGEPHGAATEPSPGTA